MLCNAGADIESRDILGKTALHLASDAGHVTFVDFVISGCGGKVDTVDVFRNTALHFAARNGFGHIVELLIKAGTPLHSLDVAGWSALHWAMENNHTHIVHTLQALGCSILNEPLSPDTAPDVDDLVEMAKPSVSRVCHAARAAEERTKRTDVPVGTRERTREITRDSAALGGSDAGIQGGDGNMRGWQEGSAQKGESERQGELEGERERDPSILADDFKVDGLPFGASLPSRPVSWGPRARARARGDGKRNGMGGGGL
jgi:hypothetical protein